MNTYQVFIDVPQDEEWINIEVESMEIEANDCWEAQEKAIEKAQEIYDDFYVWEVTEDDKI